MDRFEGRHTAIIGGATGIGRAVAERIHDEGGALVIADVNQEDGWDTASYLNADFYTLDVMQARDVQTFAETFGPTTDNLIYAAGVQIAGHVNEEDLCRMFVVNSFGVIWAKQQFAKQMSDGSMTFVASVAGLTSGGPGLEEYGASKAAVVGFAKSAARDLAPRIRVNCVCPGWTDTRFNEPVLAHMGGGDLDQGRYRRNRLIMESVPMKRQATPEEVAGAIVFLASDDASYITGHTLVVDGGLTI